MTFTPSTSRASIRGVAVIDELRGDGPARSTRGKNRVTRESPLRSQATIDDPRAKRREKITTQDDRLVKRARLSDRSARSETLSYSFLRRRPRSKLSPGGLRGGPFTGGGSGVGSGFRASPESSPWSRLAARASAAGRSGTKR